MPLSPKKSILNKFVGQKVQCGVSSERCSPFWFLVLIMAKAALRERPSLHDFRAGKAAGFGAGVLVSQLFSAHARLEVREGFAGDAALKN